MSSNSEKARSEGATFGSVALGSLIIFAIGGWFGNWSNNERGIWWAWKPDTTLWAGLADVWYIFAWAFITSAFIATVLVWKRVPRVGSAWAHFGGGMYTSVRAGVLEELIFRWLLVLSAPTALTIINWITLGLVKWVHTHWLLPLANWATLGILEPQLSDANNWVMAAAILYAAGAFRNGHAYLGFFGFINSWFIGMVMFYLVFNHGIITAIVAHFVYDAIIFGIMALSVAFRPRNILAEALAQALTKLLFGGRGSRD
ncbi:MAG TPA: hypothetical protein VJM32_05725 [Candidatus Saccharimonadales bacterium]|nr:hypothetical protein [Candidatus Saccharimonadales bacterium]